MVRFLLAVMIAGCSVNTDLVSPLCGFEEVGRFYPANLGDGCLLYRARSPFIVTPAGVSSCDVDEWRGTKSYPSSQPIVVFSPYGYNKPIDVWVGWCDCETLEPLSGDPVELF